MALEAILFQINNQKLFLLEAVQAIRTLDTQWHKNKFIFGGEMQDSKKRNRLIETMWKESRLNREESQCSLIANYLEKEIIDSKNQCPLQHTMWVLFILAAFDKSRQEVCENSTMSSQIFFTGTKEIPNFEQRMTNYLSGVDDISIKSPPEFVVRERDILYPILVNGTNSR